MAVEATPIRSLQDIRRLEATAPLPLADTPSTYALLKRIAEDRPDHPALSFFLRLEDHARPHRWTHAEWFGRITQAAHLFRRLGIQRGDVVAFVLPNLPETHWTLWGAETAGVAMAINPLLEPATIRDLMRATKPRLVVTLAPSAGQELWDKVCAAVADVESVTSLLTVSPDRYLPNAAPQHGPTQVGLARAGARDVPVLDFQAALVLEDGQALSFDPPRLDDVASLLCTGGTTGMPKIAVRTQRTEVANALQVATVLSSTLGGADATVFCGLPLFHVNAQLITGLAIWACGAHVLLGTPQGYRTPNLVARFWELVAEHRLVSFSAVPTIYAALLQSPRDGLDTSSLRFGICGAAPMPSELFHRFTTLTRVKILEGYGLTECGCVSSVNPPDGEARIGSVGLRLPWQDLRIVMVDAAGGFVRDAELDEAGVLLARGPNLFRGYLDPRANERCWLDVPDSSGMRQRWLDTGDLARMDADGYVWLAGRTKELIIRAGHNIDPKSIEEALCAHPAVALAAAIGRPDAHAGEMPVAYVQLRAGFEATGDAILAFARARIPERAAVPKAIRIVEALPTTPVGKIYKPALIEREIRDVVCEEAAEAELVLSSVSVSQDPRTGWEVRWSGHGCKAALRERLSRYVFRHAEQP
jgi:acyl-CoA synthetase (AMP-forming)/AMP-acid ligase II